MGVSEVTKYLLFLALNVVIATCGATLLAFGAILQRDELKGVKSFAHLSIGGFAIGIGVLVFILAAFAWTALIMRKPSMLGTYAVLAVVLFIIQIVLGAIALGTVNNSRCELDEEMEKAVRDIFMKQDESSLKIVNSVQRTYRCCGVSGPLWWKQMHRPYPPSCCPSQSDPCDEPFEKGCAVVYSKAIEKNVNVIGGVAIGFAIVELVAAILAWYVRLTISHEDYIY